MIDSVGIQPVGPPVGQGAMQAPLAGSSASNPIRLGAYSILGVLGRGGMGTVYLAQDARLRRRIAIKVLPESTSLDRDPLERFEREAQILATLSHPNIAIVYTLEQDGGTHFITMEFVAGQTLDHCIGAKAMDRSRAYRLCGQIAAALDGAHCQGIIHRDLKPSNVMVTPRDQIKVLDFGLAKVVAGRGGSSESTLRMNATDPDAVVGTFGYMSPEQLRGEGLDRRTDVWAFGCCLYECLSGRKAFSGQTAAEVVTATLERQPSWQGLEDLPEPIAELLHRSLEKDPERRLPNLSNAMELIARASEKPPVGFESTEILPS